MTTKITTALRASTASIVRRYAAQHQRRQMLKQLGTSLNDQLLEDIGLSRDTVVSELGYNPRPSRKLMRLSAL